MEQETILYTVEYECSGVSMVYYRDVLANSFADAKAHIHAMYPDAVVRAISILTILHPDPDPVA